MPTPSERSLRPPPVRGALRSASCLEKRASESCPAPGFEWGSCLEANAPPERRLGGEEGGTEERAGEEAASRGVGKGGGQGSAADALPVPNLRDVSNAALQLPSELFWYN